MQSMCVQPACNSIVLAWEGCTVRRVTNTIHHGTRHQGVWLNAASHLTCVTHSYTSSAHSCLMSGCASGCVGLVSATSAIRLQLATDAALSHALL